MYCACQSNEAYGSVSKHTEMLKMLACIAGSCIERMGKFAPAVVSTGAFELKTMRNSYEQRAQKNSQRTLKLFGPQCGLSLL